MKTSSNSKQRIARVVFAVLALTLLTTSATYAAAGSFAIAWWTIDGGGATASSGGNYSLGGTLGQPEAGEPMTGSLYGLQGGFWTPTSGPNLLYLPIVICNAP